MTAVIASIGTAVPRGRMSQTQLLAMARGLSHEELDGRVARVYENAGIDGRNSVLFFEEDGVASQRFFEQAADRFDRGPTTSARLAIFRQFAGSLAMEASAQAIDRAGLGASEVTHIVTASCTGGDAPGVDQAIVRGLGCSVDVERTHLGFMGCHAAINALRVARAIAESDEGACVLVCCVELCTLHFQYGARMDGQVANALFADGAAAAVVRRAAASEPALFEIKGTASRIFEGSEDAMAWVVGDHGFEMTLSARTPVLLRDRVPGWVSAWLGREGLGVGDIAGWAIHPGGPRVLDEVSGALGLGEDAADASRAVLREHGNMSSATVLFVLERMSRAMRGREMCCAMAFGPGLAAEGLLVQKARGPEGMDP